MSYPDDGRARATMARVLLIEVESLASGACGALAVAVDDLFAWPLLLCGFALLMTVASIPGPDDPE